MTQLNSPVMITVLCGPERENWINPALMDSILAAMHDCRSHRRPVAVNLTDGIKPVERARNTAVQQFLKSDCQWLVQIDNDQLP